MQSPLKGEHAGWTGMQTSDEPPRTVERKRKGKGVDIMKASMPTPPSHQQTQLPTPETLRRSGRTTRKLDTQHEPAIVQLPTPQTQRTRRHIQAPTAEVEGPSPSGHTTFFLSSSATAASGAASNSERLRRRPGLTFAQQMGLITTASSGPLTANSRGVGVGIGGHKTGGHGKVDQIASSSRTDENPFLVHSGLGAPMGLASPGAITSHRPVEPDSDKEAKGFSMLSSPQPRRSPRLASPMPSARLCKPTLQPSPLTGLLSPPPTGHARRVGVSTAGGRTKALTRAEKEAKDRAHREAETRRRMLDVDDNPFLVKPGEPSTRRPGPKVNEDLPTVTYVFRGAKKVFANPLYPSRAPFPQAELHPEDEDFEPHPLPRPKLLWPTGPSPSKRINLDAAVRTPSPGVEVSPPSSPVSTPTVSRRFGRAGLSENSLELENDPENIFSDDEGELILRNSQAHGEEHDEEELPTRRGLLFGAGAVGKAGTRLGHGAKRGLDVNAQAEEEARGKRSRGLMRL
ncbi:hypothetical protein IAU60_005012 [Kwoniella sp. DSM 27419]